MRCCSVTANCGSTYARHRHRPAATLANTCEAEPRAPSREACVMDRNCRAAEKGERQSGRAGEQDSGRESGGAGFGSRLDQAPHHPRTHTAALSKASHGPGMCPMENLGRTSRWLTGENNERLRQGAKVLHGLAAQWRVRPATLSHVPF